MRRGMVAVLARALAVAASAALACVPAARAQVITQLTDFKTGVSTPPAISRNGLTCVFTSSADLTGGNPDHSFELFKLNVATNALSQLTSNRAGGALLASIDDAGATIAFTSQADLTGGNHDQNGEVFVMSSGGGGLLQLTSSTLGSSGGAVISGGGTKIAFASSADLSCPTCGNADHSQEIFVINPDGTGLRQLTSSAQDSRAARISDDGARVVFVSSGDLAPGAPGNADLSAEVYAIGSDGTGLRQLTSSAGRSSLAPAISGNGLKVVFQSNADLTPGAPGNADLGDEVFIINWDGTGLKQLTNSKILLVVDGLAQAPSIDDAGTNVVFHSAHSVLFPSQNSDGNVEIWKITASGTGLTALTSSNLADTLGSFFPAISGDGTRVAFLSLASLTGANADGSPEVFSIKMDKTSLAQHTSGLWGFTGAPSLTPSGGRIAFASSSNLAGTDAGSNAELYLVNPDGSGLAKLTSAAKGDVRATSISSDGARIVFQSAGNYGANSDNNDEIFVIGADGGGFAQLTSTSGSLTAPVSSQNPRISAGGARIVFQSNANLTGGNPDATTEIFAINPDGSGLTQLTASAAGASAEPEIDAAGALVVFSSTANLTGANPEGNSEIFAVAASGGASAQLTASAAGASVAPHLSADGAHAVFASTADLVPGQNPEGNSEIFAVRTDGTGLRQLTATSRGANTDPYLSADGTMITFASTSPLFQPNPDGLMDLYQVEYDGTGLRRLTANHAGGSGLGLGALPIGPPGGFASSADGSRVAYAVLGNDTGGNPDFVPELWQIDLNAPWRLNVAAGAATRLAWGTRAGAWTYDAIQGRVEVISENASAVDLGAVVCIENDSPDTDTLGFEDAALPLAGRAFFYLVRFNDGAADSDYGTATSGRPRVPASGGCAP